MYIYIYIYIYKESKIIYPIYILLKYIGYMRI